MSIETKSSKSIDIQKEMKLKEEIKQGKIQGELDMKAEREMDALIHPSDEETARQWFISQIHEACHDPDYNNPKYPDLEKLCMKVWYTTIQRDD